MSAPPSRESTILNRASAKVSGLSGGRLTRGIGDDCAIVRAGAEDLLFTTDMLIEDIHFRRATHTPSEAGRKALLRALSDIAAMGGEPRFCLMSLAAPSARWIEGFFRGFLEVAASFAAPLAGGDLARSERVFCDVTVCGAVPRGKALRRSGARPGDLIYVSGLLGGSALGMATGSGKAWKRHLRPEPRIAAGQFLREELRATAAMDLSDGLSLDLDRMCAASRVSADITTPPLFPGASMEQALHGGEDYELLFTLPARARPPATFQGIPLTRIGTIVPPRRRRVTLDGKPLQALGFDHFR
jgi:thiamine-monophosphate kinase